MDDTSASTRTCETAECNLPAKLQCPTCVKLGIQNSFFCSQVRSLNHYDIKIDANVLYYILFV